MHYELCIQINLYYEKTFNIIIRRFLCDGLECSGEIFIRRAFGCEEKD